MKFSTSEIEILTALIKIGKPADIKQLRTAIGKAETRIREIISGRSNDEQKRNGLLAKCPALSIDYQTVSKPTENKCGHISFKRNMYCLDAGFHLLDMKTELIHTADGSDLERHNPKSYEWPSNVSK